MRFSFVPALALSLCCISGTTHHAVAQQPAATQAPQPDRVAAIAAMLDKTPRGVGAPVTHRAAWDKLALRPGVRVAVMSQAERFLKEPVTELPDSLYLEFSQIGNRTNYEGKADRRRFKLAYFVQAEGFENKGRFLPAIEAEISAICSERTWVMPGHDQKLVNFNGTSREIDLGTAMTAWTLATADWILGDKLKPETRQLIRTNARKFVFDPVLAYIRGQARTPWWSTSAYNWNTVVHSGITGSAMVLLDSTQERAEIAAEAETKVKLYLGGFKPDGYAEEGLGYWNYGFGHYILLAETLLDATHGGINLYADSRTRTVAQFPRFIEVLPNTYPAFADCLTTTRPSLWLLNILNSRNNFGWTLSDTRPPIDSTFSALLYAVSINNFFEAKPGTAATQSYHIRDWFEDAQVFVARPNQGDSKGLGVALKGGHNAEVHGHLDVGSFVVVSGKETLLQDPGTTVYSANTFNAKRFESKILNSYGHSVPVVAGQLQKEGAQYKSSVIAKSFTDKADSLTLDMSKAYSVPSLKSLTRQYEYNRAEHGALVVTDNVTFATPEAFGTALITLGTAQEVSKGVYLIMRKNECIQIEIDTNGLAYTVKDEIIPEKLKSGDDKVRRLGIELQQPATNAAIRIRITPAQIPDALRTVAVSVDGLKPDFQKAITIKPLDILSTKGGWINPALRMAVSEGAIRSWKAPQHALTWKINAPQDGSYALQARYCRGALDDLQCVISLDGAPLQSAETTFSLPPTSGLSDDSDDWEQAWFGKAGKPAVLKLTKGEHQLTLMKTDESETIVDWLKLVPVQCTAMPLGTPVSANTSAPVTTPTQAPASPPAPATAPAAASTLPIVITTDRSDAMYKVGDQVTFTVQLNGEHDSVGWQISKDSVAPIEKGTLTITDSKGTLTGTLHEPGFLQCRVTIMQDGKPAKDKDGKEIFAIAGAAFEPEKIKPSMPAPDDFDTFWAEQKKKLAAVPLNPKMVPVEAPAAYAGAETFDIKVDCVGNMPASGYYGRPKGAKPKSCPALLILHGAGVRSSNLAATAGWAKRGVLTIDLNAHGIENGQSGEFYASMETGQLKDYRRIGRESRETWYFLGMYLRMLRAMDFLAAQPEWDGRTLIIAGGSMGGGQAIAGAGLDSRVTYCFAAIPAMCDHTGMVVGRVAGWPRIVNVDAEGKPDAKVLETMRYFDCVNFAARVKAPVHCWVGFQDIICPPTSVYAAYNAFPGEKTMRNDVNHGHSLDNTDLYGTQSRLIMAHIAKQNSASTPAAPPGK
ncbi:MAG: acetylxylan esterase [Candidatus Methylacidiphilales bacterium]